VSYVLVVDDEPVVLRTVERMLAPHAEVRAALDAESALLMMRDEQPSVLILDVYLPGDSGLLLAQRVREMFPVTAIVFLTGDAYLKPIDTLARGVVAYLVKPFHASDLVDAMRAGLQWSENHHKHADAIARSSKHKNR
jgi:two-component system, OmpR family, response regulator